MIKTDLPQTWDGNSFLPTYVERRTCLGSLWAASPLLDQRVAQREQWAAQSQCGEVQLSHKQGTWKQNLQTPHPPSGPEKMPKDKSQGAEVWIGGRWVGGKNVTLEDWRAVYILWHVSSRLAFPSDFERLEFLRLLKKPLRDSDCVCSFLAALNWAVASSSALALLGMMPFWVSWLLRPIRCTYKTWF